MLQHYIKSSLLAVTLLIAAGGVRAGEPLSTEAIHAVEQALLSQSKVMLREAVVNLKLELADNLSHAWIKIANLVYDTDSPRPVAGPSVRVKK